MSNQGHVNIILKYTRVQFEVQTIPLIDLMSESKILDTVDEEKVQAR